MKPDPARAALNYLIQTSVFDLILAASLFIPAGRLDWGMAWGYLGPASICILSGLDTRFGWRPAISSALQVVSLGIAALGSLLTVWAMASNRFYYGVLRFANNAVSESNR